MNKINKSNIMNLANSKIIEDAARKLQQIERGQKQAEKYFKEREVYEVKLKKIETNLKRKINGDKKSLSGFEEKTFDKIENLLQILSSLDPNILEKINQIRNEKVSEYVQTDKEETEALKEKLTNVEKKNEKYIMKKNELKKDLAVAKTEIENLKIFNEKLSKENKLLHNNMEETNIAKKEIDNKFQEILKENIELKERLKKYEQNLKEYEELKKYMEEQLQIEKESVEEEEKTRSKVLKHYKGSIELLSYFKLFDKLTNYLSASDINNLKLTSRSINLEIETNPICLKDYFRKIISHQKKKINEFSKYDLKTEYHISDGELERIMSKY